MNKSELKQFLETLHHHLNILKEREAKFGDNVPLDLINQIEDHQTAIALVESRVAGEISSEELEAQLEPLVLGLDRGDTEIVSGKNIIKIGTVVIPAVPLLVLLLVVGAVSVFLGWYFLVPDRMSQDTFNVIVAEFGQIDAQGNVSHSEDGWNLSEWMFKQLQDEYKNWPTKPPVVWHDSLGLFEKKATIGIIAGNTPEERSQAAQEVAERLGAHMVIYGNIAIDENPPQFIPEFYIAEIRNEADEIVGRHQLGAPLEVRLPIDLYDLRASTFFEGKLGVRVDALVWFTRGLALDLSGRHEDALAVFKQAATEEQLNSWQDDQGREILYYFIGQEALFLSRENSEFLDEAEEAFKKALAINPVYTRAHIGLGGVYFQQTQLLPPEQRLQTDYLDLAIEQYILAVEGGSDSPGAQVEIKGLLALGKAYRLQAEAYLHAGEYETAGPIYDMAIEKIQKAIERLSQDQHRLLAEAHLGLGVAYEGKAHIRYVAGDKTESKFLYEAAHAAYTKCVKEADEEFYDSQLQNVKTNYCSPYSEDVQQVLNNL
jgi:tetratricopeptide (TPR) repeat protein